MTVTTDRGKTFNVRWAWGPTTDAEKLRICVVEDKRTLSEIAGDFDGITRFERKDDREGDKVFEGYTRLVSIERKENGEILIAIAAETGE